MTTARLGLDIGGSKTAGIVLDEFGAEAATVQLPMQPGIEGVLDTADRVVAELLRVTDVSTGDLASIGVGVPGQVDRARGEVRHAYNIGVDFLPLAAALERRIGIPVSVENDVTAAAAGAAHLLRPMGTLAYLNLGTGLAAGYVSNGVPLRGTRGVAGEIGHLPVDPLRRPCPCGQYGCLETVASGSALQASWPAGGPHPGRALLAAVDAGDAQAREAFANLVRGSAECVRLLALALDPDIVVIGGGLRLLGDRLFGGIKRTLDDWASASPFIAELELSSRVVALPHGSNAAAVGAAMLT